MTEQKIAVISLRDLQRLISCVSLAGSRERTLRGMKLLYLQTASIKLDILIVLDCEAIKSLVCWALRI